jgi:hypothetical protein
MMDMKSKNVGIVIVMMILGLFLAMYFSSIDMEFQSNLIEISREKSINIIVSDAYNERGDYILNKKYFLNSATYILGDDYSLSKNNGIVIWNTKGNKYKPIISDVSAPFEIHKEKNNDTLRLIKDGKTIILLLEQ